MKWVQVNEREFNFYIPNFTYIPLFDAAKLTIESIIKNYPPPYNLMVSGGIDSQAMLYFWNKFGRDFVPISVIYNTDYNLHDILKLEEINQNYNFKIHYKDFDLFSFLENEAVEYAYKYKCSSPCITTHIKMSEDLTGTVIYSGDFIHNIKPLLTNSILGLYRASLERKNLIPYFFLHTPELTYALQPLQKTLNMENKGKKTHYSKIDTYIKNGIPVVPQVTKTTGFENIKDYYDKHFSHLITPLHRIKYSTKHSKRVFDLLYRYPYEELFDTSTLTYIINRACGGKSTFEERKIW